MHRQQKSYRMALAVVAVALSIGTGIAMAQATEMDKTFLKDTAQDSNFEIRTSRLALSKSPSADVKAYATMVLHDHNQLQPVIGVADKAAGVDTLSPGSMGLDGDAKYAELKVLSGKTFDDAYIKGLIKGNVDTLQKEKAEYDATTIPAVKKLSKKAYDDDTKHAEKAKQLAAAHNIQP